MRRARALASVAFGALLVACSERVSVGVLEEDAEPIAPDGAADVVDPLDADLPDAPDLDAFVIDEEAIDAGPFDADPPFDAAID